MALYSIKYLQVEPNQPNRNTDNIMIWVTSRDVGKKFNQLNCVDLKTEIRPNVN